MASIMATTSNAGAADIEQAVFNLRIAGHQA
jgi:hypothetical protein